MLKTNFKNRDVETKTHEALKKLLYVSSFLIFSLLQGKSLSAETTCPEYFQNNDPGKKALLNGRIWWNQYSKAIGNQYFLDGSFLKGSVVFNGRHYSGLDLKYDIANDELLYTTENHPVICMNKEMVDSFTLEFANITYNIFNAGNDTSSILKGYVNLLYSGPYSLYVKYTKKIYPLAVDGRFDLFAEEHQVFLSTPNGIVLIKNKKKLFDILKDKKKELNHFIRANKLKCNFKNPESITPVIKYYNALKKQEALKV
jgi:hypothetical protein